MVEGHTVLGKNAQIGGLSALTAGNAYRLPQLWEGSPSHFSPMDLASRRPRLPFRPALALREGIFYFLGANLVSIVFFLPVFPSFILIDWLDDRWPTVVDAHRITRSAFLSYLLLSIPASAVLVLATVLASAAFRWLVLPRLKPGSWSIHSTVYYCKWLGNQIQESSLFVLHGLYATVYAPLVVPPARRPRRPRHRNFYRAGRRAGHAHHRRRQLRRRRRDAR